MGIRMAGARINLSDLLGKNVALTYDGEATNVTTPFGTQDVARARVIDLDTGRQGESLVFQQAIARIIREDAGEWVVGSLEVEENEKYEEGTLYVLHESSLSFDQVKAAFAKAGIDA